MGVKVLLSAQSQATLQSFKTGNTPAAVFEIQFTKGRRSEGKGCVSRRGMTKSPAQKGEVTAQCSFPSDEVENTEDSDLFMGAGGKNPA